MVDYRKLLDTVIGAIGRPDHHNPAQSPRGGAGSATGKDVTRTRGHTSDQLLQKAKDFALQNPGLTQTALVGLAGLLFKGRKKGKLAGSLAKLGGLAVIGGLAYKAFQNQQAKAPASPGGSPAVSPEPQVAVAQSAMSLPETSRFHPVSQTEDDALLFLRTMVAAAAADGRIDQAERARIVKGLIEAGIDPESSHWLENEMASPADVDELAEGVNDPEMAAQVYAAARIAIDPDTIQEREFLHQLAEALDLDPEVRAQIDETAGALS
ncbi:tellurite resistance TerB family protein [Microvirga zambiensis]|uniref:tellurite resistance TerB family protein n=1 Tax=Microvirga zambiensis TaxID=1402137 RepID=UPI00191D26F6|nr:tellurite resistance TerB family protein [Microvirga zambiensis]